ncbi:MAG TPA: anti-sigma regulatory factor [Deltaproteobacteria bacterium]|nr:anti-sigma regulatory factor [Deltaproteobacteria bacterium]
MYLEGVFQLRGRDFVDAGLVSSRIKNSLKNKGVPEDTIRKIAVIAFETEINIISYAKEGTISFYLLPDRVVIEAEDSGEGIENIEMALQEGFSTADDSIREMGFGAGMGLPNIRKFSDDFEIVSEPGRGTYLKSSVMLNGNYRAKDDQDDNA